MNFVPIIVIFNIIVVLNADNVTEIDINDSVHTIADTLVVILGINEESKETDKIKDLKEKIKKINVYATDKNKYTQMLSNEVRKSDLNATNFYEALNDRDHFQFRDNGTGNLYLKLKAKMNRDDVLRVLAEKGSRRMMRFARRMMDDGEGIPGRHLYSRRMEDVVDKLLAETARDDHKYNEEDHTSNYWDPEAELQDINEYHRYDNRRLFRGERTTVRYHPYMVSIHVMGRFWCGGVLYWQDIVLTSAACLQLMHNNRYFRENPRVLAVRVGSNHSRIGGEVIDAVEVYFHPAYNPRTLRNNIAVIRLRRMISFHKKIPKLIQISHDEGMPLYTSKVTLLGWGVTKTSQKMAYEPIFLQKKVLPIYPNQFCKEVYGDKFITSSMFCAGTLTTGEGACDHDAGGPAVMYGQLIGIISFGPTVCGYPNVPTVFTLVGYYADWIETVNQSMPSYYRGKQQTTTTSPRMTFETMPTMTPVDNKTSNAFNQVLPQILTVPPEGGPTGVEDIMTAGGITQTAPTTPEERPPGGGGAGGGGAGGGGEGGGGAGGGEGGGGGEGSPPPPSPPEPGFRVKKRGSKKKKKLEGLNILFE